jgi:hypothetical protein
MEVTSPEFWSQHTLELFVAFFVPGFISTQIYRLFVACEDEDFTKNLPAVIAYSALHYGVFGWLLLITSGVTQQICAYLIIFFAPIVWPFVILLLRDWEKWSVNFKSLANIRDAMLKPEATPWDRVFTNKGRFVRITLKKGRMVGGYLADYSEIVGAGIR